jgi:aspartate aminotransferase
MTSVTLADRLQHIEASPTLALAAKAKALAKAGKSVVDFTAGEPDLPTPEHIKQAGIQAILENHTKYTPVAGIPELRAAIVNSVNRKRNTSYQLEQAIVTCGTKHALYNAFQALCQRHDEVIVVSPYWVSFPPIVRLAGAKPIVVEARETDQFLPDPEVVRYAITDATKAIIINSPSNPTGAVIDKARLEAIARIVLEHELVVVSDEIYDQLVYAPAEHLSIVQAEPKLADQTVIVGGVSKTYSMTGWRIGYALGPKPLMEAMVNIQSHSTSNPTSISQHAALAALTGDQNALAQMLKQFQQRRDRLVSGLNRINGLRCAMPQGAFYAWCNVQGLGQSSEETAAKWLEHALVATVPGEGFGAPGFIRFSFATSIDTIDEGLKRLSDYCRAIRRG